VSKLQHKALPSDVVATVEAGTSDDSDDHSSHPIMVGTMYVIRLLVVRARRDGELPQYHIGRPIIVRFIRAVPMRRIDLRRDARRECPMTTHLPVLLAETMVDIMARNLRCERR
jgi:hypothetical protein